MSKSAMANFAQALAAVLLGNLAYFLLLPHLPSGARHVPSHLDGGMALDFGICLLVFLVIKAVTRGRGARS